MAENTEREEKLLKIIENILELAYIYRILYENVSNSMTVFSKDLNEFSTRGNTLQEIFTILKSDFGKDYLSKPTEGEENAGKS